MKRALLFCGVLLTLNACVSYKDVQLTGIAFKDVNTSTSKFRVSFDIEVDNPNKYPITLSKPDLKVLVANKALENWSSPQKIKLKRKRKESYPFYIEVSGAEALQLLPSLLMNPSIKIEGSIKAGSFLFKKRIPVSLEEKFY